MARSSCVVVGERNSSVSDRMQDSISPFTKRGACAMCLPIRPCMMVAVQASGRMVMSIGPLVSSPPTSLWWSMIAVTSSALILAGNSAGLLVSTTTAGVPSAISDTMRGLGQSQCFSTKAASVLGSPSKTASAGVFFTSFRNHAQIMGDPVESVSGE